MSSKAYACLHIKPLKNTATLTRAYKHNIERTSDVENVDKSKTHLNRHLIELPEGKDYNDMFKQRIKEEGVKNTRKNQTKAVEFMLTYSQKNVTDEFKIDEWCEKNVEWLKENFGEKNVVSVELHLDETTPHIHAIVIPIVDKSLNATRMLQSSKDQVAKNGMRGYTYLQDSYCEKMKEFGLQRGLKKTGVKHTDLKDFYSAYGEYLDKNLSEYKGEDPYEYAQKVQEEHRLSMIDSYKEIKELEREIVEIKGEKEENNKILEQENEIKKLREQLENSKRREANEELLRNAELMNLMMKGLKSKYYDKEQSKRIYDKFRESIAVGEMINQGKSIDEIKNQIRNRNENR